MNNILLDLSGKIEPEHVRVLAEVKLVAEDLRIPFFVVGATARDYIFEHGFNRASVRMTRDVDIGVQVGDWDTYEKLTRALLAAGGFEKTANMHRLSSGEVLVDIVPFGGLADRDRNIHWPPDHEMTMSVLGFQDAYDHSITVRLHSDPLLEVRIPTVAGLALIKLIAWNDDPGRQKDADDLLFIMRSYESTGIEDRLFGEDSAIMEAEGFDARKASVRLLGRDMAMIADAAARARIMSILDQETGEQSRYRLIRDMLRGALSADDQFDGLLNLVERLKLGFSEGSLRR